MKRCPNCNQVLSESWLASQRSGWRESSGGRQLRIVRNICFWIMLIYPFLYYGGLKYLSFGYDKLIWVMSVIGWFLLLLLTI